MRRFLAALLFLFSCEAHASDITRILDCAIWPDTMMIDATGSTRVLITFSSSLNGGCVITPEVSLDPEGPWYQVSLKREAPGEIDTAQTLNSALTGLWKSWVYENTGWPYFRLRISAGGSPGFITTTLATTGGGSDSASIKPVTLRHTKAFSCTMTSTATTLTQISGGGDCVTTPPAGERIYITGIQWASSIISTTTNFMLFRSGTTANCAANTTDVWRGFINAAFAPNNPVIPESAPLRLGAGHSLCFVHPGAGTRFVNIQGYTAP